MQLPAFRYHPDPLATGAVVAKAGRCDACEREVGHLYDGPMFGRFENEPTVCPWCIADGSAASKLGVHFNDPCTTESIAKSAIEEISDRTPGYTSWQGPEWMFHCGDGCAFLGDASLETLRGISAEGRAELATEFSLSEEDWHELVDEYEPGAEPAIYHFRCLSCGTDRFHMDMG